MSTNPSKKEEGKANEEDKKGSPVVAEAHEVDTFRE
jgi:hypothetical protein